MLFKLLFSGRISGIIVAGGCDGGGSSSRVDFLAAQNKGVKSLMAVLILISALLAISIFANFSSPLHHYLQPQKEHIHLDTIHYHLPLFG